MAGIFSQGGSAGHRYAGWLSEVEAKNFQFGGKVFNGSPSAIYVGSNLVWTYWLKAPAMTAIYGAFGQRDGMAVIKATNAYLNQLAASGMDKAQALAGFINEDPMMVCSLGLQPELTVLPAMPWRGLFGDGKAWLDLTGIIFSSSTNTNWRYRLKSRITNKGSGWWVHGIGGSSVNCYVGISSNRNFAWACGGGDNAGNVSANSYWGKMLDYDLDFSRTSYKVYEGSTLLDQKTLSIPATPSGESRMGLYCWRRMNNGSACNIFESSVMVAEFGHGDNIEHTMYPFNDNGTMCLLDIDTKTKYYNANTQGQFTEEFGYMQNGSWVTWTPSTP